MPKLWQTLFRSRTADEVSRYSHQEYLADLWDSQSNNLSYGYGSSPWSKTEDVENDFVSYCQALYKSNGVVYAVMAARRRLFRQARFMWQEFTDGKEGPLFWTPDLEVLRKPWPNGTTGELLARMDQDTSLGGNFYAVREGDRLRRLRPDWVTIVLSAPPAEAVRSDVVGYWYHPGRVYSNVDKPASRDEVYLPHEMCHWTPEPDPEALYRGMSWLTPVVREVLADKAATLHKERFFANGAFLGLIISAKENLTEVQFDAWKRNVLTAHQGPAQAYKPLFLASPVDTTITTADMRQLDFKITQGHGETRICADGGVPAIIVGVSEGLEAATYSNYGQARRAFGDGWAHPQWEDAAGAIETLVDPPDQPARLWYAHKHIAFLRDDARDAAEVQQIKASTIVSLVATGAFLRRSAIAAVEAEDMTLLEEDPDWVSVQLQQSGGGRAAGGAGPKAVAARSADLDDDPWDDDGLDEQTKALIVALAELAGEDVARAWDPAKHPRNPAGQPGGGRFRSMVDRLKDAIEAHLRGGGDGHPFDGFDRDQLRRAAKARGIALHRGEDRDSIAQKLLDSLRGDGGVQELLAAPEPPRPRVSRPRRPAGQPQVTPRQREHAAGRAATVASLITEQLWREHTLAGRRRAAADVANATWWQDDWDGADELRDALRRYSRGDLSIEELRRVGDDIEARHHLRREGVPGDRVRYDPATMEPSTNFAEDGLRPIDAGDQVEVTAPGYRYTGGRVEGQPVRTRVRPVGGAAAEPSRPARPRRPQPATSPRRPAGPPELMLDGETDVPAAGTMFDRARDAFPTMGPWDVREVDPRPFQQILDGDMAGLRVYGMDVQYARTPGDADKLQVNGRLENSTGRDVGNFTVTFRRESDGTITAYHDFLQLERSEQGSGFANEYGMRLLTWYRDSGVNKMTLHANIDVGGYAWARMGFNWTNAGEVDRISDRLGGIVQTSVPRAQFRGAPNPDEQVRLGRELLGRMRQARTLDQYPTPYEISQLGRWPGAGRDDMWVGKALLLGSSWHGTLTLSEVEHR